MRFFYSCLSLSLILPFLALSFPSFSAFLSFHSLFLPVVFHQKTNPPNFRLSVQCEWVIPRNVHFYVKHVFPFKTRHICIYTGWLTTIKRQIRATIVFTSFSFTWESHLIPRIIEERWQWAIDFVVTTFFSRFFVVLFCVRSRFAPRPFALPNKIFQFAVITTIFRKTSFVVRKNA